MYILCGLSLSLTFQKHSYFYTAIFPNILEFNSSDIVSRAVVDSEEKVIHAIDFQKYGLGLWILCVLLLWVICFLGIYRLHGFPEGVLETANQVPDSSARQYFF
jgi:hypothetical protein